jgi:AraC-like DNA-binding protein
MSAYENFYNNYYRDPTIENLFRILFNKFSEAYHQDGIHTQNQELSNLRFEIKNNPGFPWTVPFMAERLHLSIGHLQFLYRKTFHTTCMDDVIHNRILLAKEHLAQSVSPVCTVLAKEGGRGSLLMCHN